MMSTFKVPSCCIDPTVPLSLRLHIRVCLRLQPLEKKKTQTRCFPALVWRSGGTSPPHRQPPPLPPPPPSSLTFPFPPLQAELRGRDSRTPIFDGISIQWNSNFGPFYMLRFFWSLKLGNESLLEKRFLHFYKIKDWFFCRWRNLTSPFAITSDDGLQYRRARVGRGVQPNPSTHILGCHTRSSQTIISMRVLPLYNSRLRQFCLCRQVCLKFDLFLQLNEAVNATSRMGGQRQKTLSFRKSCWRTDGPTDRRTDRKTQ